MTYLLLALISSLSPLYGANANASASAAPARGAAKEEKRIAAHAAEPPAPLPDRSESPFRVAMEAIVSRRPEPDKALIQYQKIINPHHRITVLRTFLDTLLPNDLEVGKTTLLGKLFGQLAPSDVARIEIPKNWKPLLEKQITTPAAMPAPSASASAAAGSAPAADVKMAAAASASASASAAAAAPTSVDIVAGFRKMLDEAETAKDIELQKKALTQVLMEISLQQLRDYPDICDKIIRLGIAVGTEFIAIRDQMTKAGRVNIVNYLDYETNRNWVTLRARTSPDACRVIRRTAAEDVYVTGNLAPHARMTHGQCHYSVNISAQHLYNFTSVLQHLADICQQVERELTTEPLINNPGYDADRQCLAQRAPLSQLTGVTVKRMVERNTLINMADSRALELFKISGRDQLDIPLLRMTLAHSYATYLHTWHDQAIPEDVKKFITSLSDYHKSHIASYYFCLFGIDIDPKLGIQTKMPLGLAFSYNQIPLEILKPFPLLSMRTVNERLQGIGTPLEYAIARKYPVVAIRALIKVGADVNSIAHNDTPLVVATLANHPDAVKELLSYGADVKLGRLGLIARRRNINHAIRELLQKAGLKVSTGAAIGDAGAAAGAAAAPAENAAPVDKDGDVDMSSSARK